MHYNPYRFCLHSFEGILSNLSLRDVRKISKTVSVDIYVPNSKVYLTNT
jgi:hypothetical protein